MRQTEDSLKEYREVKNSIDTALERGSAEGEKETTNPSPSNNRLLCGGTPHPLKFVNRKEYIHITGDKIPHWNQVNCVQFVSFRLADSLPQSKLQEFRKIKEKWFAEHPKPWDTATQAEYETVIGGVMEEWIDAGYGECLLKDKRVRDIIAGSIMHFDGERYGIHAFVIMPNHVHVLLSPRNGYQIQDIVGRWKKFSAHEINKLTDR